MYVGSESPAGADPTGKKGRPIMTNVEELIGGVDSHKDTIHVAVITSMGHEIDDRKFPTAQAGYRNPIAWLVDHGRFDRIGVEGTSSYGVGVSAALHTAGMRVVEVNRTRPAELRRKGKSDRLDACRAARSILDGEASKSPKRASIATVTCRPPNWLRRWSQPANPTGRT